MLPHLKILFLDRGRCESYSAGSQPAAFHPRAVHVMSGVGIDMSGHPSRHDVRDQIGRRGMAGLEEPGSVRAGDYP